MPTYSNLSGTADASAKYFWTLDVYENVQEGQGLEHWVKVLDNTKAVYKGNKLRYSVRVWKKKGLATEELVITNPDRVTPLYGGDGVSVLILNSWRTEVAASLNIGSIEQTSSYGIINDAQYIDEYPEAWKAPKFRTEFPYYQDAKKNTGEGSSKEIFYFDISAKVSDYTFYPKIYVKLNANSDENAGATDLEVLPHPTTTLPTIKFTAAKKEPSVPKQVRDIQWADWATTIDKCSKPNRWVTIVKETRNTTPITEVWCLYYYSLDGLTRLLREEIGSDYKPGTKKVPAVYGADGKDSQQEAIKKLQSIKVNACDQDIIDDGKNDDEESSSEPSTSRPVTIAVERTNPPNHFYTRDVSLWTKIGKRALKEMKVIDSNNLPFDRSRLITDATSAGRLGMIMQDESTAIALNKPENAKKPWGFRFTYNPTSFSYTTSMDYSIDWMLAEKDPANFIGGNVGVSFQLYLNRVVDMSELDHLRGKPGEYGTNYPRPLKDYEIQGLLYRGTEYDLEYLYRVLNGDPVQSKNALLTYQVGGQAAETSDFGYITGTPIWLKLHDNLRYKGSVASISVTHQMFNEFMVPIFSTVDITMVRYPVLGDPALDKKELEKAKKERAAGAADASSNPAKGE
jgi:hypothetical protein